MYQMKKRIPIAYTFAPGILFTYAREKRENVYYFSGSKADEATELYRQAANLFKMAKKWNGLCCWINASNRLKTRFLTEAGSAFVKGAELNLTNGDAKHHAAMCYMDAANCYRKTQPKLAADCLKKAAEIYTDMVSIEL